MLTARNPAQVRSLIVLKGEQLMRSVYYPLKSMCKLLRRSLDLQGRRYVVVVKPFLRLCFAFIFVAVPEPPAVAPNHGSLNRLL